MILIPKLLRTSSSPIILPMSNDLECTCRRCRLFAMPYSFTSVLSDLPLLALAPLKAPGFERNLLLNGIRSNVPTKAHIKPTGRNVKKPSPSYPLFMSASFITRLGGVPIRVIIPLMLLAKARGMSRRLGFILTLMAILTTIGIIIATVPVLLTNAPMREVTTITSMKSFVSLLPASFISLELIIFASPVWKMAPPTTKRPTIIIMTLFENPERASAGSSIPRTINATSEHNATISERTFPLMKKNTERRSMTTVSIII